MRYAQLDLLRTKWHPRNKVTIDEVTTGSHTKYWWLCPVGHEWQSRIISIIRAINTIPGGCPYCRGLKVDKHSCLLATHPELARQWHPDNQLLPTDVSAGSNKKVFWMCKCGHKWKAIVISRVRGNNCPYCSHRLTNKSNCLSTTHPELARQWHSDKNNISPDTITAGSGIKVWWKCPIANDHEWMASPNKRTAGRGCPYCAGQKACSSNCLSTLYPEIAEQWHPTKNGDTTPNTIIPGSHKKYWWLCPVSPSHEWQSTVSNRTKNKNGCPFCDESKGEAAVSQVLQRLNIPFQTEKTFPTCKDKGVLFFDFCIKTETGYKLIEYQGVQHYRPTFGSKPEDVFNGIKRRDQIKKDWCRAQGIDLLEIPYWKLKDLDNIVQNFIEPRTVLSFSLPDLLAR